MLVWTWWVFLGFFSLLLVVDGVGIGWVCNTGEGEGGGGDGEAEPHLVV